MRIRFWDRVVAALGGLLLLLLGAGVFAFGVGVLPFQVVAETLRGPFALWQRRFLRPCALSAQAIPPDALATNA